jgi:hypothetical protein
MKLPLTLNVGPLPAHRMRICPVRDQSKSKKVHVFFLDFPESMVFSLNFKTRQNISINF